MTPDGHDAATSVEQKAHLRHYLKEARESMLWKLDGLAEPNTDMWATADESRHYLVGLYQRVWRHTDTTIEELDLESPGFVPWWPGGSTTLYRVLVHVVAEVHRHAGHAEAWWDAHRKRVEHAASA